MARPLRPPKEIEVEQKNVKLRVILLIVCISVAVVSLGYGISLLVNRQTGWQTVEISSNETNCAADFNLQYYLEDADATAQYRQLNQLYSQACVDAYELFNTDGALAAVNVAPNTDVKVDPALYKALEQVQMSGNRCIYLAPVYVEYNRVFICDNEAEAAVYDPARDSEKAKELSQLAAWCNDPAMVDLQLKGDNTVCLKLAGEYHAYAQEYELDTFLDFGWLKNAFIADYIAGILVENGFVSGYLTSYDGFTRNLDTSGQSYRLNIFDCTNDGINKPGVMEYTGPMAIVVLRDYPLNERDRWKYFAFSDGEIVTAYVDPVDGMSKSAIRDLTTYSQEVGCAQIALEVADIYLADTFQPEKLQMLADQNIYAVWCQDKNVYRTQSDLLLGLTDNNYNLK